MEEDGGLGVSVCLCVCTSVCVWRGRGDSLNMLAATNLFLLLFPSGQSERFVLISGGCLSGETPGTPDNAPSLVCFL